LISRLPFATPFVYSTQGASEASKNSRKFRDRIKGNDDRLFEQIAEHVEQLAAAGVFPQFFGPSVVLVPVPGHAPLAPGAVSTAERIATALAGHGLGTVSRVLTRTRKVTKSAWAKGPDRPRAKEHFDTITMEQSLIKPQRIVLIDDFVTRGSTFLGAASRMQNEIADADIKAFALVRSITTEEIDAIRDPVTGILELTSDGESRRRP
jgi:adenine/guanine phosphoribosyltransferase-like PRPP-binding protein